MSTPTRCEELFVACKVGDFKRVRRVIADGVDPKKEVKDWLNETPVHTACKLVRNYYEVINDIFDLISPRSSLTVKG